MLEAMGGGGGSMWNPRRHETWRRVFFCSRYKEVPASGCRAWLWTLALSLRRQFCRIPHVSTTGAGQSESVYKMGQECAPGFSHDMQINSGHLHEPVMNISPKLIIALLETWEGTKNIPFQWNRNEVEIPFYGSGFGHQDLEDTGRHNYRRTGFK